MFDKNEFQKYAVKHRGMSSMHLEKYMDATTPDIKGFTPYVIEERLMNIQPFDVFSRLMMDRIIFLGVPIDNYVANVIQAQLLFMDSTDQKRDVQGDAREAAARTDVEHNGIFGDEACRGERIQVVGQCHRPGVGDGRQVGHPVPCDQFSGVARDGIDA